MVSMSTEGEFADYVYGSMHWKLVGQNLCLCDDLIVLRFGSAALVGSLPQDGIQRRSVACLQAQQAKSRHDLMFVASSVAGAGSKMMRISSPARSTFRMRGIHLTSGIRYSSGLKLP